MFNPGSFERYSHDRFQRKKERKKEFKPVPFERYNHERFQRKKVSNPVSLKPFLKQTCQFLYGVCS